MPGWELFCVDITNRQVLVTKVTGLLVLQPLQYFIVNGSVAGRNLTLNCMESITPNHCMNYLKQEVIVIAG